MSGCFDTAWAVIKIDSDEERIRYMADAADAMYGRHRQRTMHDFGLPLDPDFNRTHESPLRFSQQSKIKRERGPGDGFARRAQWRRKEKRASRLGLHDFDNLRIEPAILQETRYELARPRIGGTESGYRLVGERDGKTHDLSKVGLSTSDLGLSELRNQIQNIHGSSNPDFRRKSAYRNLLLGLINAGYEVTSDERNPYSNPFHEDFISKLPKDFTVEMEEGTDPEHLQYLNSLTYFNPAHPLATGYDALFHRDRHPPEFGDLRTSDPVGVPFKGSQRVFQEANEAFMQSQRDRHRDLDLGEDSPLYGLDGRPIPEQAPQPMGDMNQTYFPSAMVGVNRARNIEDRNHPRTPWRNPDE